MQYLIVLLTFLLVLPAAAQTPEPTGLSGGVKSLHVVRDADGNQHAVFGRNKAAFYARSDDDGKSWSKPVKVNNAGQVMDGGQIGPKLAIGPKGKIYVTWCTRGKQFGGDVHFAMSDDGKSFTGHKLVVDVRDKSTQFLHSMGVGPKGAITVMFLDRRDATKKLPWNAQLYYSRSTDGGKTFSKNLRANARMPGWACDCCGTDTMVAPDGTIYVLFRGEINEVRDIYLLRSKDGKRWTPKLVSNDQWRLNGCPADPPRLGMIRGDSKHLVVTWMTAADRSPKIYFAISKDGGKRFSRRRTVHAKGPLANTPGKDYGKGGKFRGDTYQKFPSVTVRKDGTFAIAWQGRDGTYWATFTRSGKSTGKRNKKPIDGKTPLVSLSRDGKEYVLYVMRDGDLLRTVLPR